MSFWWKYDDRKDTQSKYLNSSISDTKDVQTETVADILNDPQYIPCVRYGKGHQLPYLRRVDQPVPEGAKTASEILLLTPEEKEQHNDSTQQRNPWSAKHTGDQYIANEIQDQCHEDGRVLYPFVIDCDDFTNGIDLLPIVHELSEFLHGVSISPDSCTWWFSGRKGVHVHLPVWTQNYKDIQSFKEAAESFNSQSQQVEIDTAVYSRKGQFRLPGVKHYKTGRQKLPFEPANARNEIAASIPADYSVPATFEDVLNTIVKEGENNQLYRENNYSTDLLPAENGESDFEGSEEVYKGGKDIGPPSATIPEQECWFGDWRELWQAYNFTPWYPHAHTEGEGNWWSVAVVQAQGSLYQRKGENPRIPCTFLSATAANGEFRKDPYAEDRHARSAPNAPLKVSDYGTHNYDKFTEVGNGDHLVVIGKQSWVKVIEVGRTKAQFVGNVLRDKGRKEAVNLLQQLDHDVGSEGTVEGNYSSVSPPSKQHEYTTGKNNASSLRERAEQDDVEELSHNERLHVANHLLACRGEEGAHEWFREQYGEEYDYELTQDFLQSILRKYSDLLPDEKEVRL